MYNCTLYIVQCRGCPKTSGQPNFEGYSAPHASSNFYWPGNVSFWSFLGHTALELGYDYSVQNLLITFLRKPVYLCMIYIEYGEMGEGRGQGFPERECNFGVFS